MKLLHWIQKQRNRKTGFTLVELIVVLVILAILAALLVPALTGYMDKAKEKQVIAETRSLLTAIQTEMSELYGSDIWNKTNSYFTLADKEGRTNKNPDPAYAQPFSSQTLIDNYNKIVSLSEVPSLQDNGKGQFFCHVDSSGKVKFIIYDSGRGYIGCYFTETNDITAYKQINSGSLSSYYGKVIKYAPVGSDSDIWWSRKSLLYMAGCTTDAPY